MLLFYIVSFVFALLYVILVFLFCKGWSKLPVFSEAVKQANTHVSIIIAARNESQNIKNCLQSLIFQNYPRHLYEIIVIDDNSTDNTIDAVEQVKSKNSHSDISILKLKSTEETHSYKKKAIACGIEKAKGSLMVTTDADCVAGPKWLSSLVAFYETHQPKLIAAPVIFHHEESIFQKMQSVEFAGLIVSGAAGIYYSKPFMCNGANLAYEKQTFYDVNGFEGIDHVASGDDVLLMNKINVMYKGEIMFLKSHDAVIYTKAKSTAAAFMQQRIRWASKGLKDMNGTTKFVTFTIFGFNLLILLSLFLSMFQFELIHLFFLLITIKCTADFCFLFLATSFFNKQKFLFFFLPEQILYMAYVVLTGFMGAYGKYEWKGRRMGMEPKR